MEILNPGEKLSHVDRFNLDELGAPVLSILTQLREDIEKGSYGIVLGEDVSGRLPALVVWTVLKNIYVRRGFAAPRMRFVAGEAGTTPETFGMLETYISQIKKEINDKQAKVLIVTDTINFGTSLRGILKTLQRCGVSFDIATIGFIGISVMKQKIEQDYACKIAVGMNEVPSIYGDLSKGKVLAGTTKERGKDVIARKATTFNSRKVTAARQYLQKYIIPSLIEAYDSHA